MRFTNIEQSHLKTFFLFCSVSLWLLFLLYLAEPPENIFLFCSVSLWLLFLLYLAMCIKEMEWKTYIMKTVMFLARDPLVTYLHCSISKYSYIYTLILVLHVYVKSFFLPILFVFPKA